MECSDESNSYDSITTLHSKQAEGTWIFAVTHDRFSTKQEDVPALAQAIQKHFHCRGGVLHVGKLVYELGSFRGIALIAMGKAAVPMAEEVTKILQNSLFPSQVLDGVVVGATIPNRHVGVTLPSVDGRAGLLPRGPRLRHEPLFVIDCQTQDRQSC